MTEQDRKTIVAFAAGDRSLRELAIDIFRAELREIAHLPSQETARRMSEPAMRFMSEIDNVCPDNVLRAEYRKSLTGA